MHVTLTGHDPWALEGVAQALRRHGLDVVLRSPADAAHAPGDVVVAVGLPADAAATLDAALPTDAALLWLGGAPPRRGRRPSGVLSAHADDARLLAAVQAVAAGLWVQDAQPDAPPPPAVPPADPLTPREQQVFELMAKGLNNREIAQVLGITPHTAKFHVAQILEKTGSASRTEAVSQGLRAGWIGL